MACWDQAKGDVPVFPELLPAGAALALTLTIEKPGPSQRVPPKIRALASLPPCPIRMPQHSGGNGDHTLLLFFPPLRLLLFCLLDWCTLLARSPNAEVPKRSSSRCLLHPGPAHPCPGLQHIPLPSAADRMCSCLFSARDGGPARSPCSSQTHIPQAPNLVPLQWGGPSITSWASQKPGSHPPGTSLALSLTPEATNFPPKYTELAHFFPSQLLRC